jgi:NAD(P)H dehydrogenase (quinone)
LADVSGKPVTYAHMPEDQYRGALESMGLPAPVAAMLAESSATAAGGALFDDSRTLSGLIGRSTTPLSAAVRQALK